MTIEDAQMEWVSAGVHYRLMRAVIDARIIDEAVSGVPFDDDERTEAAVIMDEIERRAALALAVYGAILDDRETRTRRPWWARFRSWWNGEDFR